MPLFLALLLLNGCAIFPGREPDLPEPQPVPMGTILLDAGRREVIATGFVNQVEGHIELLACGTGGKVHESILVLNVEPKDLQAGLLMLGLQSGPPSAGLGKGPPQGSEVRLFVMWSDQNGERQLPAERLVYDFKTKKPARHGGWVFNGSMIKDGFFMGDAEESLVATFWDPWAIVNIKSLGDDDDRLGVNSELVPPRLTPVRLVFRVTP